jgi:hypothetical protein
VEISFNSSLVIIKAKYTIDCKKNFQKGGYDGKYRFVWRERHQIVASEQETSSETVRKNFLGQISLSKECGEKYETLLQKSDCLEYRTLLHGL